MQYPQGPTVRYALDAQGTRLAERHFSSGELTIPFDTSAELTKSLSYTNTAAGQLSNIEDELLGGLVAQFGYDASGRMESWTQNGQTRTFTWDVEDRLRGVDWTDGVSARYDYDHAGMRIRSEVLGQTNPTTFVWGAGELLEEQQTTSGVTKKHRYERRGELVVGVALDTGKERFLRDGLGSIVGRKPATGPSASYRFDAWGNYNSTTGPPAEDEPSIGYTGHHVDVAAGLTYAKARWYAPELGRFLSTDPILSKPSPSDVSPRDTHDTPPSNGRHNGAAQGVTFRQAHDTLHRLAL